MCTRRLMGPSGRWHLYHEPATGQPSLFVPSARTLALEHAAVLALHAGLHPVLLGDPGSGKAGLMRHLLATAPIQPRARCGGGRWCVLCVCVCVCVCVCACVCVCMYVCTFVCMVVDRFLARSHKIRVVGWVRVVGELGQVKIITKMGVGGGRLARRHAWVGCRHCR